MAALPFGLALAFNLLLIPLARRLSVRVGRVAAPRADRWHTQPTPTLGGVGIFAAFALALILSWGLGGLDGAAGVPAWGFLSGSALLFAVGLYDEFRPLSPAAKLVAQILAATLVIGLGFRSTFFNPRIANPILAQLPNILFTYVWLVGITNAFNLLDNMDGLAGGIGLISAAVLGYFFWQGGSRELLYAALALAGSLLGFLVYNFPPARIFMGDSGSLFLGFTLAALAIAQQQQASDVLAVIGAPTLIFLLPILDTALVTITRLMRGASPAQGGRDHTSHRLVAFGLSERQALLVLYAAALSAAVTAAALERLNYWLSLALAPLVIVGLALLTAYLGRLKVVDAGAPSPQGRAISRWMTELALRRRLLEALLDFFLIGIAFYLAFLVGYDLRLSEARLSLYLDALPFAFACAYLALYALGVYRAVWRYVGMDDLLRYFLAAAGAAALLAAVVYALSALGLADFGGSFPPDILVYFAALLFMGLALTRSSFRLLDALFQARPRPGEQPVVIVGAGDAGEMALRWILMNPQLGYRPVGFIDPDPLLAGRRIHGIRVLGGAEALGALARQGRLRGVILAEGGAALDEELQRAAAEAGVWVRRLRLEFEEAG
ncbi:MAG: hypothetical protein IT297_09980 [Anaerolineae bacterium]|nr:hypothetical protein [Anaerolineae bacterium]